ncbi:MAG TPA: alpha-L-fucosidase [Candidatus Limnocylindrales bacterium]|nr:alpha-L-fucosidase [Candidatus Limnocylindrales bacterium]
MKTSIPRDVFPVIVACWILGTANSYLRAAPAPIPDRLQWWAEARLGMFIHWGPVSLKETEISWSRANTNPKCPNRGEIPADVYDNLYRHFNPTNFNAEEWVATAKAAGMKYMVLTAKHGDGFLLWDSKLDNYNIMHTPFKRDVCGELARAAHAQGMRIGWYFSPMDWRDPDCRTDNNDRFVAKMHGELRELLTHYGKIDLLWFDCDGREAPWNQATTYALVKKLQPEIIINNRLDMGLNDNPGLVQNLKPNADYFTPEQQVGGFDDQHPWESCMTISRRGQWSWGGPTDGVKSLAQVMEMLIGCAGGDGNMLLNVGPRPTGEIDREQSERVREIGEWLAKYGESIYSTRGGPFKPGAYGASTRRGKTVYLHILDWDNDAIELPSIPGKVLRRRVLTGDQAEVSTTPHGLRISLPERERQQLDTVIALEFDRDVLEIAAVDVPLPKSLSTGAKATASNIFQGQPQHGPDKAIDGRNDTRWATDAGVHSAWLEINLGRPCTFRRATIRQGLPELQRIRRFAIEYLQDSQWKACYQGTNPGAKVVANFRPITAQKVRLNIAESTDGPTISEFQLFE